MGATVGAIGVATLGVGARTRELLAQMFARAPDQQFRLVEPAQARVVLVDLDTIDSAETWVRLRVAHPHLIAVALCTDTRSAPDGLLSVSKPIDPSRLLDALHHAERQQSSTGAAGESATRLEARDVDALCGLSGSTPIDARFDPERYLQAVVADTARAVARTRTVHTIALRHAPDRCIVLRPEDGGRAAVLMTESLLHGLACTTDVSHQLKVEPAPQLCVALDADNWMATESLIWMLALYAAHGRLPARANPSQRVRLRRWPNLTRLLETPGAMSIAAHWTAEALSVDEAVRAANVPARAVFAFYAACDALKLFEHADAASSREPARQRFGARTPSVHSGLFARLIGRLLGKDAA